MHWIFVCEVKLVKVSLTTIILSIISQLKMSHMENDRGGDVTDLFSTVYYDVDEMKECAIIAKTTNTTSQPISSSSISCLPSNVSSNTIHLTGNVSNTTSLTISVKNTTILWSSNSLLVIMLLSSSSSISQLIVAS